MNVQAISSGKESVELLYFNWLLNERPAMKIDCIICFYNDVVVKLIRCEMMRPFSTGGQRQLVAAQCTLNPLN